MNIRNVLRTYSLLRQLTDDESALLETLRNATDTERELLVETLSPQKSTTKRAGKKSNKSTSKSSRAQSLSGVIQRTPKVKTDADNNDPNDHCQKQFPGGLICDEPADANVHHLRGATGYHEFNAGKSSAPHAGEKSSTNGGAPAQVRDTQNPAPPSRSESDDQESRSASSSPPNSEDETVSAGAVVGGSSE